MITEYDFIPKWTKCGIFTLNILHWFAGIFSAAAGLYVHLYKMKPIQELISMQMNPDFIMIVMGIVLFITAIFGFVGALRENVYVIRWYLVTLLFLLMVYMTAGVIAFVVLFFPPTVPVQVEEKLQKALLAYRDDDHSRDYMDKIQASIHCCGVGLGGYKDWMRNPYFACIGNNLSVEKCGVPPSCCRFDLLGKIDTTCGYGTTSRELISQAQSEVSSVIYTKGCVIKAEETAQDAAALIGFVAFGIATSLICGIVMSSGMLNTLEMKVNEYWKRFNLENSMMHYVPNSAIYHIPAPGNSHKTIYATTSDVHLDGFRPLHTKSAILM